jgi:lipopolysaccharide transport system ATP-binding protein/teichoic acid transport system ATP-binding protein
MQEMMRGGTTVLFVSHDVNAIRRFCSRAIWLNGGVVMGDGETNRTIDEYLDFQKLRELNTPLEENGSCAKVSAGLKQSPADDLPEYTKANQIAEIRRFRIYDENGCEVGDTICHDQKIVFEVIYDVYEPIDDPVLGIAVRTSDLDYTCGLNTLLDKCRIPWEEGRNRFYLEYSCGIRALGGLYQFDVALYDKTASVPIQYISAVKQITVLADYIGEGRYIIPHRWLKG